MPKKISPQATQVWVRLQHVPGDGVTHKEDVFVEVEDVDGKSRHVGRIYAGKESHLLGPFYLGVAPTEPSVAALHHALLAQHQWHLAQTDEDEHGIVPAHEYPDSTLCEKTLNALTGADAIIDIESFRQAIIKWRGKSCTRRTAQRLADVLLDKG